MTTDDFADASLPVFAGVFARGGLMFRVGPAAASGQEEQPRRFGAPVACQRRLRSRFGCVGRFRRHVRSAGRARRAAAR
jgi:hypothetical protein